MNLTRVSMLLTQAAEPSRLSILVALAEGELNVGQICARTNVTQPGMSHHLALLKVGGDLVSFRREGKTIVYSLTDTGRRFVEFLRSIAA